MPDTVTVTPPSVRGKGREGADAVAAASPEPKRDAQHPGEMFPE
jgi:hypothetical protein